MKPSFVPAAPCDNLARHPEHVNADGRCNGDVTRLCDADARRGTGTGICDRPLDEHGNCDRAAAHL